MTFLIEQPGQPPRRLTLTPRLAAVLTQLAGPEGMAGGTQASAKAMNELRGMGLPIDELHEGAGIRFTLRATVRKVAT